MKCAIYSLFVLALCSVCMSDYDIDWYTIDGGGCVSAEGDYELVGTIGQPDAGVMSGGDFVLSSGFWAGSYGCVVNLTDLAIFLDQWLLTEPDLSADFDDSGIIDIDDFVILSYWWFEVCPADWPLK